MFIGNWATLIIPWNTNFTIDTTALREEINIFIESKVDGIYSCGSAGEFHLLLEEEFIQISEILSEECVKKSIPFQIGASHFNPNQTLERISRIQFLSPNGIQVIAPDWWCASSDVTIKFLNSAAEVSENKIPLILYNPPHAKKVYSIKELFDIKSAVPMLKGMKVAGGDDYWYTELPKLTDFQDLSIFIPGHLLASGVKKGAHGAYSNVACINPGIAQKWANSIMQGQWADCLEIEGRLNIFMKEAIRPFIDRGVPNYIMDRAMAVAGAWGPITEICKWPYRGLSLQEIDEIKKIGHRIIPEFFS